MAEQNKNIKSVFWGTATLELLRIIDDDQKAFDLFNAFGGQRCYIPKQASEEHPWVPVLGLRNFRAVCRHFGGGRVDIPNAHRAQAKKLRIVRALLSGDHSNREIARRLQCTERYVRMVARDTLGDSRPTSSTPENGYGNHGN